MSRTGRPPLSLGTYGEIRTYSRGPGKFQARTLYRDFDGATRDVARNGRSGDAAIRALKDYLRDRVQESGGGLEITPSSTVESLAEAWWAEFTGQEGPPGTMRLYRGRMDKQIIPAVGKLRVRELTTGAVSRLLVTVEKKHGAAIAKVVRTVLSNMCAFACRMDAMKINPVREVKRISTKPRKPPRALALEELQQLRALFTYDSVAVRRDVPLVSDILVATGLRLGECLAIVEDAVGRDEDWVEVRGKVVRVKGEGLFLKPSPKSAAGFRKILLPSWSAALLRKRFERTRSYCLPVPVLGGGSLDSPLAFPTSAGKLRDVSNVDGYWRAAVAEAGFPGIVPHTMRKTVATEMDKAGLTGRDIADQLGQANISLVYSTYLGRKIRDTGAAQVLEKIAL